MPPTTEERWAGWAIPALTDAEFCRFRKLIHTETGIHLRDGKQHLLVSRLGQRLRQLGLDSFTAYYDRLKSDPTGQELVTCINRITTNKTSFFRESHHFDYLKRHVIPKARTTGCGLRIWSAACSSGEEPYSIAISIREALGTMPGMDVRILASDIDTEMLQQAASGIYSLDAVKELTSEQRKAHFLRGFGDFEGAALIRPEVRRMIEFRRINLIETGWPPPASFDAVFCRNVIIYFDQPTQQRTLQRLVRCVKPDGHLFAGHSESLHGLSDQVTPVGTTIYRVNPGGTKR